MNRRIAATDKSARSVGNDAAILQRACACGQHSGSGECASCKKKRLGLQRAAVNRDTPDLVPPIVHEVLRSTGKPLDDETRTFMESRFQHDFSKVRVHTNDLAASAANMVNASAFTVGNAIAFANGQFHPETESGKFLLAHELTHVMQQRAKPSIQVNPRGLLMDNTRHSEAQAEANAHRIISGAETVRPGYTSSPAAVACRGPAVRPPVRAPARQGIRVPEGQRYAVEPDPFDTSLEAILARAELRSRRERAIFEGERPYATLERGGRPPGFVTDAGEESAIGQYGMVRYRKRNFHILDAIEYEVSRARSERDLIRIRQTYIPEVILPENIGDLLYIQPVYLPFDIPTHIDPDGSRRMEVYTEAVAQKALSAPFALKGVALSEETERRRRNPSSYPICWATQLGPPTQLDFVRTTSDRDDYMAKQARMQVQWREQQGDLDAQRFHVHHVNPLFLGGVDNLQTNGTLVPARLHLKGHRVLQFQPQLLAPPPPLAPLPIDLYRHRPGVRYELVGFKREAHETC